MKVVKTKAFVILWYFLNCYLQQKFKVIYELKMYCKIKTEFYFQIDFYKPTDSNWCLIESDPDVFTKTIK